MNRPSRIEGQHEIVKLLFVAPEYSYADQHVAMTADRDVLSGASNDHCLHPRVVLYGSDMSTEDIPPFRGSWRWLVQGRTPIAPHREIPNEQSQGRAPHVHARAPSKSSSRTDHTRR